MALVSETQLGQIKEMYYGQRLNAREIADKLGVSSHAVYGFMERHKLERRSMIDQNRLRFEKKQPSFKIKMNLTLSDERLLIAGVMLYWAEGFQSESAHTVDFANSKSEMIMVFLKFLRRVCGIDESKLRAYLYCYSNQDIEELISFWSKLTKIPKDKFSKPYVRKDFKKEKIGKMRYGLFHVRYADKKLLNKIREWIIIYSGKLS